MKKDHTISFCKSLPLLNSFSSLNEPFLGVLTESCHNSDYYLYDIFTIENIHFNFLQ